MNCPECGTRTFNYDKVKGLRTCKHGHIHEAAEAKDLVDDQSPEIARLRLPAWLAGGLSGFLAGLLTHLF